MRLNSVALLPRSPVLRVWLPSLRCELQKPLEASFSPQHSWDSPFRAFLLIRDLLRLTSQNLRPCAFPGNLTGLLPALQRLTPQIKPCLFPLPGGLVRVETSCSLGLVTSQALSLLTPSKELLPLQMPLPSFVPTPSQA